MITFRLALFQAQERYARELVEEIKKHPGCCDTVWLTAMGYYPSLEKHVSYAEGWIRSSEIFREAGLEVSMQIANTCGHMDSEMLDPKYDNEFMWGMRPDKGDDPYMVGPDGTKNKSCFCWRSESFREYINSVVKIYAERLKPTRLWFDDDLRAHNHMPNKYGCYCDRCILEFNKLCNTEYSRDELVRLMNYEDTELRRRYIEFSRKGIYDFVYGASRACLEVSPDTSFGYEYDHEHIHNYLGKDDLHVLSAFYDASKRPVHTRPGGGYYNDKSPWDQYEKALKMSELNSRVPDYVSEIVAEVENLPGVLWGKSIGGIVNEATVDLAVGCTALSFTDVQSCHEPIENYGRLFEKYARLRPYWERLADVSKRTHRGGVAIYVGEAPHLRRLSENEPFCAWERALEEPDIKLTRLGVAVTHDQKCPSAYLVHHDTVDSLTDNDIRFLLTKPVITDGESVDKIRKRGFAESFALSLRPVDNNTEEHFTACEENGKKAGLFYNENPYAASPMRRYVFEDLDEKTKVLGEIRRGVHLSDGALLGAGSVVTSTSEGGKWAIFGYSLWSDIVSSAKRNQIVSALDSICNMPARVYSEEQIVIIPSVDKNGKTVSVTLSAVSQNGAEEVLLGVRAPVGRKLCVMGTRRNDISVEILSESDGETLVRIKDLVPYETVTLFFE